MTNKGSQKTAPQSDASPAQKSAIDALQKFYGLIVAAAFMGGLLKFLETFTIWQWPIEQLTKTLLFIAFLSTIVPFYHGMERHLFETHVARNDINWGHNGRPSNILVDIFAFMLMGALLFSMGRRIDAPIVFFQIWSALLALDICWSLLVWGYQKGAKPIWAGNNACWLIVAWLAWYTAPWIFEKFGWPIAFKPVAQTGAVAIIEILRSVFDYRFHWEFYFPDEHTAHQNNLIYLAAPYSNDAPRDARVAASEQKRLARFDAITEVARQLIENKTVVYSPLTMTHPIDVRMNHDPGSEFWVSFDESFMQHCGDIYVLQLPGWDQSSGLKRELEYFQKRGIKPTYLNPVEYGVTEDKQEFRCAFE